MKKEAIVLLNMGGPNNLDEVAIFLSNMFNDKNILTMKSNLLRKFVATMITKSRTKKSQEMYKLIGSKSPIVGHTKNLVKKLQDRVDENVIVDFVMRYTPPFANEVIQRLKEQNVDKIYLLPLYPQYSTTTTKSSLEDFREFCHLNNYMPIIEEKKHFFENENYNLAILQNIKNALESENFKDFDIIFSAHGLPQKIVDNGDVYQDHVVRHVEILKNMMQKQDMNFANVHLAYQSKVGPMEWLKPSLEDKLKELDNKKVLIFPIAFTIDNSETDFELDMEYREVAEELGYEDYKVAKCPNESDFFVEALYEMYKKMK